MNSETKRLAKAWKAALRGSRLRKKRASTQEQINKFFASTAWAVADQLCQQSNELLGTDGIVIAQRENWAIRFEDRVGYFKRIDEIILAPKSRNDVIVRGTWFYAIRTSQQLDETTREFGWDKGAPAGMVANSGDISAGLADILSGRDECGVDAFRGWITPEILRWYIPGTERHLKPQSFLQEVARNVDRLTKKLC